METFRSSPPAAMRADLARLRASLDSSDIPPVTLDRIVLIAIGDPTLGDASLRHGSVGGASTSGRRCGSVVESTGQLADLRSVPAVGSFSVRSKHGGNRPVIGGR
jgi:hypothetical protein